LDVLDEQGSNIGILGESTEEQVKSLEADEVNFHCAVNYIELLLMLVVQ